MGKALFEAGQGHWLVKAMEAMPLPRLLALQRVAKTRCVAFFKNPYAMIALREIITHKQEK